MEAYCLHYSSCDMDRMGVKRRRLDSYHVKNTNCLFERESTQILGSSSSKMTNTCQHPVAYGGICVWCTQHVDDEIGLAFGYIDKHLRLSRNEVARLRDENSKSLLRQKKLCLVLDLDHTLLNSARLANITTKEKYLNDKQHGIGNLKGSLHCLDNIQMMTKLRPYVHTFLEEANKMFELYIYTLGERPYALEMAKLLDPEGIYFSSRIIAREDCTENNRKSLDIVLEHESVVLILDDTSSVWQDHKENLIEMQRYHFFKSSTKQFGQNRKSLSEQRSDESEINGALATVLKGLKHIHTLYFDQLGSNPDVRQVLKTVRNEVLRACRIAFSGVFPVGSKAENHPLWKMAVQLGATCCTELDSLVTHVVSRNAKTEKSRRAVQENKFLVSTMWIEAANYFWQRQPEQNFRLIC